MVKNSHGGKRKGAGRKPKYPGPKTRIQVPTDSLEAIEKLLVARSEGSVQSVSNSEILRPVLDAARAPRPLFASYVQAGFPSPADDYIETLLDLNEHMVKHPSSTFYVRVSGESMIGAGILPGDILVVDRSLTPADGNIVIAVVDDELTVKRLRKQGSTYELHAENPAFEPICIKADMELVVWGVVSGVTRSL